MIEQVIADPAAEMVIPATEYYINPTGAFSVGGPQGDTGLTGGKIAVDTYGGMANTVAAVFPVGSDRSTVRRPI